ncbi:MAG: hypothetical protein LBN39_07770 [Planctomycetaceae bacterium]|nr:hypothetical protein [Planctomycetaceae bacterium]
MHFEILVEDASGKLMLEHLVPKIIGKNPYRIMNIQELKHRVMARMPRHLARTLPWDDVLFQTLSVTLRAYGRSLPHKNGVVVVVVDLDYHSREKFQQQLESLFDRCSPRPPGGVRLAVEEGEAWLLGDPAAVYRAYPLAKKYVIDSYEQDSVCGTWEVLADAVFRGGAERLKKNAYPLIGKEKCRWADNIGQYVDAQQNTSPSFQEFRKLLNELMNSSKNSFLQ